MPKQPPPDADIVALMTAHIDSGTELLRRMYPHTKVDGILDGKEGKIEDKGEVRVPELSSLSEDSKAN